MAITGSLSHLVGPLVFIGAQSYILTPLAPAYAQKTGADNLHCPHKRLHPWCHWCGASALSTPRRPGPALFSLGSLAPKVPLDPLLPAKQIFESTWIWYALQMSEMCLKIEIVTFHFSFNFVYIYPSITLQIHLTQVARLECSGHARGNGCCHALPFHEPSPPRPAPPCPLPPPPQARGATGGPASQPISAPGQLKHYPCCV